jgi:chemotaxis signal transduction protein
MMADTGSLTTDFPDTYLAFRLGEGVFAFEARSLWEISTSAPLSSLPRSFPFLVGVTHLHGKIVPVVDLCQLLELPPLSPGSARAFIAVKPKGWTVPTGFYAEDILGFERFLETEINLEGPSLPGTAFRKGRAGASSHAMEILDMGRLLDGLKPTSTAMPPPESYPSKGENNV